MPFDRIRIQELIDEGMVSNGFVIGERACKMDLGIGHAELEVFEDHTMHEDVAQAARAPHDEDIIADVVVFSKVKVSRKLLGGRLDHPASNDLHELN
jgi:hypothetical protein